MRSGGTRSRVRVWTLAVGLALALMVAAACDGASSSDGDSDPVSAAGDEEAAALYLPADAARTASGEPIIRGPGSPASIAVVGTGGRTFGANWRTDWTIRLIGLDELVGRVERDDIASIDDPSFSEVDAADVHYADEALVMMTVVGEDVRAYPLTILSRHEIVNDVVGGMPVAVTYCPVCTTGVVFDRRVDGRTLEFGTSGLLRNNDLVMYDRASESLWQQIGGRAIVGTMVGARLRTVRSQIMAWDEFRDRYPEGLVLS